jgi:hypothetical protein
MLEALRHARDRVEHVVRVSRTMSYAARPRRPHLPPRTLRGATRLTHNRKTVESPPFRTRTKPGERDTGNIVRLKISLEIRLPACRSSSGRAVADRIMLRN